MNCFELAVLACLVFLACLFASVLGQSFGVMGYVGGFAVGLLVAGGLFITIFRTLGKLVDLYYTWCPLRPPCKNGTCTAPYDYSIVQWKRGEEVVRCRTEKASVIKCNDEGTVFRCRCGREYFQPYREKRRFLEVLDDGSTKPYMKRSWLLGPWREESNEGLRVETG